MVTVVTFVFPLGVGVGLVGGVALPPYPPDPPQLAPSRAATQTDRNRVRMNESPVEDPGVSGTIGQAVVIGRVG